MGQAAIPGDGLAAQPRKAGGSSLKIGSGATDSRMKVRKSSCTTPFQSLSVVGLFELPRKLPIPIARWGETAWHRLGSHEPAFHFLTVVAPSGVPPAITRSRSNRYVCSSLTH